MSARSKSTENDLIFRQHPGKIAFVALCLTALVLLGASFALNPEHWETHRRSASFIRIVGWLILLTGGPVLALIAISARRPATVRLTPDALIVTSALVRYSAPWTRLSNFRIWSIRGTRVVVFDDETPPYTRLGRANRSTFGATSSLPNLLNATPEDVLEALKRAKLRAEEMEGAKSGKCRTD